MPFACLTNHSSLQRLVARSAIDDELQQPITYNHYYTDNVQKARQEASHDLINKIVMDTTGGDLNGAIDTKKNGVDTKKNGIDLGRLFNALQKHVTVDMDEQACSEVRVGLDAYYKVCW